MNNPRWCNWAGSVLALVLVLVGSTAHAGGMVLAWPQGAPKPHASPLVHKTTAVHAQLRENYARTEVEHVFHNPSRGRLEGYFLLPLSKRSVIRDFSMEINGVPVHAELLEAKKARGIYEEIVRKMKDPALMEYHDRGLFKVRIFPIEPNTDLRVKLVYAEELPRNSGTWEYNFLTNVARYGAKAMENFRLDVDIEAREALRNVFCPTHEVEIIRKGERGARIGYEGKAETADSDLRIYFDTDQAQPGLSLLCYNDGQEDGYFQMSMNPGFVDEAAVMPKAVTFVLDVSGSMDGKKLEQAKNALNFCIDALGPRDLFNIVPFSTEARAAYNELVPADRLHRAGARAYVNNLRAAGGTNIYDALARALSTSTPEHPHMIIFITDGKPTIGETREAPLLARVRTANPHGTRIFTFGIGTEVNTHLLDKITETTRAYQTYVLPEENIEYAIRDFFRKASSPVLTDIRLKLDGDVVLEQVYPKALPDLFNGSTITIMGRYRRPGPVEVAVTGKVHGARKEFRYTLDFPRRTEVHEFVPALWAARSVGFYLDQMRLHGEKQELIDEVVRLARQHGIISPYTSYLIIEDERQQVAANRIRPDQQLLRNRVQAAPSFQSRNRAQFDQGIRSNSGARSIDASRSLRSQNAAVNMRQLRSGGQDMQFRTTSGGQQDLAAGIRNVNGRAFYQDRSTWVDANVARQRQQAAQRTNRMRFGSPEYFEFSRNQPAANEFLALGRNVRFIFQGEMVEIYE